MEGERESEAEREGERHKERESEMCSTLARQRKPKLVEQVQLLLCVRVCESVSVSARECVGV
jgi:hypothetical protein